MAGYREFQTGEVLTAANVNDFLMDQSVMKFADAAARDTALGTAVGGANALREGMVAYLDSTDDLLKFDGTAWATVGGGLVAVKHVLKTDTFTASVAAAGFTDITDLSITHSLADASNTLLLFGQLGVAGNSVGNSRSVALAVAAGGTRLSLGDASSNRMQVNSAVYEGSQDVRHSLPLWTMTVYAPGSTSSITYTLQVGNGEGATSTVYVNRTQLDNDDSSGKRGASSLILMEVSV